MPKTEAEILARYANPLERLATVLQACLVFGCVFVFFFLAARLLNALWAAGVSLRQRWQKRKQS